MLVQQAWASFFALLGRGIGLAKCNLATSTAAPALRFYSHAGNESISVAYKGNVALISRYMRHLQAIKHLFTLEFALDSRNDVPAACYTARQSIGSVKMGTWLQVLALQIQNFQ
jgi:hypothetical protein